MANNQDCSPIRSFSEVEKRISGLVEGINKATQRIVKTNNELAEMLKTLLINLSDYMDQGEVALWFYSGEPTTSNEPYISWTTPSEHEGDFYYDQEKGLVYQFNIQDGWQNIDDDNLVQAMAITNAELQEGDHERKIFLSQPIPPYENGDWWIKSNGDLFICQIDAAPGSTYSEMDFIASSLYSLTIASKTANTITVMKGTLTEITEDYVKFTDLSTSGSTTIAGDNISTGSIKSNNYSESGGVVQAGTKLNLNDGSMATKNWSLNSQGKMTCKNASIQNATIKNATFEYGDIKLLSNRDYVTFTIYENPNDTHFLAEFDGTGLTIGNSNNGYGAAAFIAGDARGGYGGQILLQSYANSEAEIYVWNLGGQNYSLIKGDYIRTPQVIQTSEASKKKNIEIFNEDALEIVKNTDIYKYHLLNQKDTEKKHIGFVIGDNYKYSKAITNNDNDGAELYSMISVLWQAVKQQQEEIEKLRKEEG